VDKRLNLLFRWAKAATKDSDLRIHPASADASFRRYFRVENDNESFIVMDAPPDKEDTLPYQRVAKQLLAMGLNVPKILDCEPSQGFLLLSDLGYSTYLAALDPKNRSELYGDAINALIQMQIQGQEKSDFLPPYDRTLLRQELEIFRQWYLLEHRGYDPSAIQLADLDVIFEFLVNSALEQPSTWVHRDFHSRNLMYTREDNPGILDFQDAVYGPISYDLVSLLRDCYIRLNPDEVLIWVKRYHQLATDAGLPVGELEQFLIWFDLMGIQRHLKATGIFARLNHRDGKANYLVDIPRVLDYIREVSGKYRQLQSLFQLTIELVAEPNR